MRDARMGVEREEARGLKMIIHAVKKQGRNSNGFHLDAGSLIHGVADERTDISDTNGNALCGTSPGRRSGGWYYPWGNGSINRNAEITCAKCLKKSNKND